MRTTSRRRDGHTTNPAPSPKKPRTPTDRYSPATWLRKHTSTLVWGEKVGSRTFPKMNKEELVAAYNSFGFVRKMKNEHYRNHAQGHETHYFQGNTFGDRTLAMIDVDVQKARGLGSTEAAIAFVEHLKKHFFPDLYWEMSTGGKGVHAYVVIDKTGVSGKHVNDSLRIFEKWLRRRAEDFDIELVEVMGHCPEVVYDGSKIRVLKFGSFAKHPRHLDDPDRFESLKNTTVIGWRELRDLPERDFDRPETAPRGQITTITSGKVAHEVRDKPKRVSSGSITGKHISPDDLARLLEYKRIAESYLGGAKLKTGEHAVRAEDFAIAFLLLKFIKENENPDGSLPQARVEKLWQALYREGDVDRGWNKKRWPVIRDTMSRWGLLDWIDNRYQPGYFLGDKWQAGVACKWGITDGFYEVLTAEGSSNGGASFGNTDLTIQTDLLRPKRVWTLITPPYRRLNRLIHISPEEFEYRLAA
jgi:hypothetical protein